MLGNDYKLQATYLGVMFLCIKKPIEFVVELATPKRRLVCCMDTDAPLPSQAVAHIAQCYMPLSPVAQSALAAHSRVLTVEKGTPLVKEGQFARKTFFVVQGCVRAYYLKEGRDVTTWFAFENEFICPLHSFFLGISSPHYIETIEKSTLLEMDRDSIDRLSDQFSEIDRLGKYIVTQTMLALQARVEALQFETALQKYDTLMRRMPEKMLRMPLTHIASYLGITLETLSRIRNPNRRI